MPQMYTTADGDEIDRTWANVEAGLIPLSDLDDEELTRMRVRNVNGGFAGRGTAVVSRDMHRRTMAELRRRYEGRYIRAITVAQDVFIDTMTDTTATPTERLRAAQYVQERIMGKVPDKVEVTAEIKPWEGLVQDIVNDV